MTDDSEPLRYQAQGRVWQSRGTAIASVTVLAIVALVVAGGFVVGGLHHHSKHPTATHSRATTFPASATSPAAVGPCTLPAGSQTIPTVAPKTSWVLVGTISAPNAPDTYGPQHTIDGFRQCYADDPTGALFAAAGFLAAASANAGPQVLLHLEAPTAARAIAIHDAETNPQPLLGSNTQVEITAFSIPYCSANQATVDIVLQTSSGGDLEWPLALTWNGDDWKVVNPSSTAGFGITQVANINGFVPWSGA